MNLVYKEVLRAIRRYGLIEKDEKICVALSGGKDSTALLFILNYLRRHSPLSFDLSASHIKTADYDTSMLRAYCDTLEVPYFEGALDRMPAARVKNHCYLCARLKRGALSALLRRKGIRKAAFGHHATDAAETFLMNLVEHGKIGSFCPRVATGSGPIIIRPMIYLEEQTIIRLHRYAKLPLLDYSCPFAEANRRTAYKKYLEQLEELAGIKRLASRIVQALDNVDTNDIWKDLIKK